MSGLWVNSDKSCILILKSWYYIIILDSLILILQLLFLWAVMYARFLLKTSHFGWISDILFPFSHCNTVYAYILCMYCENVIIYQKSISKFFVQKIPRVHFIIFSEACYIHNVHGFRGSLKSYQNAVRDCLHQEQGREWLQYYSTWYRLNIAWD